MRYHARGGQSLGGYADSFGYGYGYGEVHGEGYTNTHTQWDDDDDPNLVPEGLFQRGSTTTGRRGVEDDADVHGWWEEVELERGHRDGCGDGLVARF
jgi:hypothetical protein